MAGSAGPGQDLRSGARLDLLSERRGERADIKLPTIRRKAIGLGVDRRIAAVMGKAELIAAIQIAEGNTPCFGARTGGCGQSACCWMADCDAEARRMAAPSRPVGATQVRAI